VGEQGESAGILRRREVLTGVALLLGPIEGVSVTLTASVYFLLPLAPSTTDPAYPEPTPPHRVLTLFAIAILFELILPEGLIGYISQVISKRRDGKYGNMIEAAPTALSLTNCVAIGAMTIAAAFNMHYFMVTGLCPRPHEADGAGLLSFAVCCPGNITQCDSGP